MNSLTKLRQRIRPVLPLAALLLLLAAASAPAQIFVLTNFFTGTIPLTGDISDFFLANGLPRPGVCCSNDSSIIVGVPGSEGLGPNGVGADGVANEPNNRFIQIDNTTKHPSGFNQRRLIAAYNPALNGGTIFVGLDLPGGTGSSANPNFSDSFSTRGSIRPFDADGNGEPETIGRKADGITLLARCSDAGTGDILDIVDCSAGEAGGFSDAAVDGQEIYSVTIVFGPDPFSFTAPR